MESLFASYQVLNLKLVRHFRELFRHRSFLEGNRGNNPFPYFFGGLMSGINDIKSDALFEGFFEQLFPPYASSSD